MYPMRLLFLLFSMEVLCAETHLRISVVGFGQSVGAVVPFWDMKRFFKCPEQKTLHSFACANGHYLRLLELVTKYSWTIQLWNYGVGRISPFPFVKPGSQTIFKLGSRTAF